MSGQDFINIGTVIIAVTTVAFLGALAVLFILYRKNK